MRTRHQTAAIEIRELVYGCHEVRQDSERILSGMTDGDHRARYEEHLRSCSDCRRFHRVLTAIYEGPRQPFGLGTRAQEREFAAILNKTAALRGQSSTSNGTSGATSKWLAFALAPAMAAAALLWSWSGTPDQRQALDEIEEVDNPLAYKPYHAGPDTGGIEHRAQHFGRILSGVASLRSDSNDASPSGFGVGTVMSVDEDEPLQFGLMGSIMGTLSPDAVLKWNKASSNLVELQLDRGFLAIRYDRRRDDPLLLIRTQDAIVRVTGTVFTVEVTESNTTSVSVLRGAIDVLNPNDRVVVAEVSAGQRFDVAAGLYDNLGAHEVAVALPLAEEDLRAEQPENSPDSVIPRSWSIPGLAETEENRTLDRILDPTPVGPRTVKSASGRQAQARRARLREQMRQRKLFEEERMLRELIAEAVRSTRAQENDQLARELASARTQCTKLYDAPATRIYAARCLQSFMDRFDTEPEAQADGLLAIGILRMDFARDFPAAIHSFEEFISRFPSHARSETALYRLMVAHIESGNIAGGMTAARRYIRTYPRGANLGLVLQRFPELKAQL